MFELVVLGGGPAGLAAALEARKSGVKRITVIERDREPGGVLQQCIHSGFGLQIFREELTGPEYAQRFIDDVHDAGIEILSETMVLDWTCGTDTIQLHVINPIDGWRMLETETLILAMGCRERTRGAIALPGDRPAGIFTAGTAQRLLNREGYMIGRRVVILGSGDIGLIMARRLTLEGTDVLAVAELMPYSNGLTRNIVQCLDDFDIPLLLSHTVINVLGKNRVEKVILARVDDQLRPIPGTEREIECDTLLLSVGLIPENDLSAQAGIILDPRTSGPVVTQDCQTSQPGIFACGNVLHVHDLVDYVTLEARIAGRGAANFLRQKHQSSQSPSSQNGSVILVYPGNDIANVVPQRLCLPLESDSVSLMLRTASLRRNQEIQVWSGEKLLKRFPRQQVFPAEMERISLSRAELENVADEITVRLAAAQVEKD